MILNQALRHLTFSVFNFICRLPWPCKVEDCRCCRRRHACPIVSKNKKFTSALTYRRTFSSSLFFLLTWEIVETTFVLVSTKHYRSRQVPLDLCNCASEYGFTSATLWLQRDRRLYWSRCLASSPPSSSSSHPIQREKNTWTLKNNYFLIIPPY